MKKIRRVTALIKCRQQIKEQKLFLTCAPISELPSYIRTMAKHNPCVQKNVATEDVCALKKQTSHYSLPTVLHIIRHILSSHTLLFRFLSFRTGPKVHFRGPGVMVACNFLYIDYIFCSSLKYRY